ncbi:ABC transporter substrate-binding protein [Desulfoplanes formicivorans]|nr:ABC transporter substrate binding protein [Desulfoplanes formicivorans]
MILFLCVSAVLVGPGTAMPAKASKPHILVVMSHEQDCPWVQELSAGIQEVLGTTCDLSWEYMDATTHPQALSRKGKQIFEKFRHTPLAGILAADDAAQAHFVVPFIKDKSALPTIFVGVEKSPLTYGYPAQNVTGILKRHHLAQTLSFARMLIPNAYSVAFMLRETEAQQGLVQEIHDQSRTFPLQLISINQPATLEEALTMAADLRGKTDLLFVASLDGLVDEKGTPLLARDILSRIDLAFGKPILGATERQVLQGALLAVTQDGHIQGKIAASMLREALDGTPIQDIPIRTDIPGKRILNIAAMRALGINPKPAVLVGTRLVLPKP